MYYSFQETKRLLKVRESQNLQMDPLLLLFMDELCDHSICLLHWLWCDHHYLNHAAWCCIMGGLKFFLNLVTHLTKVRGICLSGQKWAKGSDYRVHRHVLHIPENSGILFIILFTSLHLHLQSIVWRTHSLDCILFEGGGWIFLGRGQGVVRRHKGNALRKGVERFCS